MGDLKLALGCWDYDRVQPLMDGASAPGGST